jgi:RNA polymerase sigma-70 factor (ECF subfamily)
MAAMDDHAVTDRNVADDETLVRRILEGKTDLFAEVIHRHQRHVARIVGGHVPEQAARDVAHEVFVRAYSSLGQFAGQAPFEHWLAGIAVRTCYDFWRAAGRDELPVSALTSEHQRWIEQALTAQSEEDFRRRARQREAKEILDWGLRRLSPEHRLVLTLVHLDGYSVAEAARLLGWSVVNVKVRAHRARKALRNAFKDMELKDHDTTG